MAECYNANVEHAAKFTYRALKLIKGRWDARASFRHETTEYDILIDPVTKETHVCERGTPWQEGCTSVILTHHDVNRGDFDLLGVLLDYCRTAGDRPWIVFNLQLDGAADGDTIAIYPFGW